MRRRTVAVGIVFLISGLPILIAGVVQRTDHQEPYQVQVPYQYEEAKSSRWVMEWYSISYSGAEVLWGSKLGQSEQGGGNALLFNWGSGTIYGSRLDYVGFQASETVYVSSDAQVSFTLGSDDGSRLFIDSIIVIDNWGYHPYTEKTSSRLLSKGEHTITVWYAEKTEVAAFRLSFDANYVKFSWTKSVTKYRNETRYRSISIAYVSMPLVILGGLLLASGIIVSVVGARADTFKPSVSLPERGFNNRP